MDVRRFLKPLPESDALTGSLVQVGLVSGFKVFGRWLYAIRPDSLGGNLLPLLDSLIKP